MDLINEEQLQKDFQIILDLIAQKNPIDAEKKLFLQIEKINELIDLTAFDEDILILGRYQLLIEHLQIKINRLKSSFN